MKNVLVIVASAIIGTIAGAAVEWLFGMDLKSAITSSFSATALSLFIFLILTPKKKR